MSRFWSCLSILMPLINHCQVKSWSHIKHWPIKISVPSHIKYQSRLKSVDNLCCDFIFFLVNSICGLNETKLLFYVYSSSFEVLNSPTRWEKSENAQSQISAASKNSRSRNNIINLLSSFRFTMFNKLLSSFLNLSYWKLGMLNKSTLLRVSTLIDSSSLFQSFIFRCLIDTSRVSLICRTLCAAMLFLVNTVRIYLQNPKIAISTTLLLTYLYPIREISIWSMIQILDSTNHSRLSL